MGRYGIVSDVHANLPALRVALDWLAAEGAERLVCAGDVVGYGPHPNECVEQLASAGALTVAGNHDLMVLGELDDAHEGPNVRDSTAWTRRVLGAEARCWLAGLPRVATEGEIVVAHGSLEDPQRYVERDDASAVQLRELSRGFPGARVLVLGHTHRPRVFQTGSGSRRPPLPGGRVAFAAGAVLVNPGSVGQSRQPELEPRVRAAVLDVAAGEVRFAALGYDVAEARRQCAAHGLPRSALHLVPGRAAAAARRLAATARRAEAPAIAGTIARARRRSGP